ncbi:MAG: hypothetical protein ABIR58_09040 [Gemmatimonadaceae bacterium]
MTLVAPSASGGAYQSAGRVVAPALRGFSSVIVASDNLAAAAHVAIGIALAESAKRLVMVGDLVGDLAPLQRLVTGDDPHGIYDSFAFGTSFGKVAQMVEGVENFFFMPSGTDSPSTDEILGSPRWGRFASEFASSGELLLLVADPSAPAIGRLLAQMDGIVLVGLKQLDAAPDSVIIARVPHSSVASPAPRVDPPAARRMWSSRTLGIGAAALVAAGIVAGAVFAYRASEVEATAVPVLSTADSPARAVASRPRPPAILPVNPADSLIATPFSIEVLSSNTAEGASFELQRHRPVMPGATVSLVPIGDTEATWYKVYAGAFVDSADANRLLMSLRRRRIMPGSAGTVVRAPFALLVDTIPSQGGMGARTRERVQTLIDRSVPAYALMQRDGSARVYAGAFQSPEQSSLAATDLRVKGLTPQLAYRTGRIP